MGETAGSNAGQQCFKALRQANRVRRARKDIKDTIRCGRLAAADVIVECPWEAYNMPVSEVLTSQERWGDKRCRRVLVATGIPENKTVGTLTDRQRAALVAALKRADTRPERTVARRHALEARERELSAV